MRSCAAAGPRVADLSVIRLSAALVGSIVLATVGLLGALRAAVCAQDPSSCCNPWWSELCHCNGGGLL